HQGNEKLQRQKHSAQLAHRLGLNIAQSISAVKHLNRGEFQHIQSLRLAAKSKLIRKNDELRMLPIRSGSQARTKPGTFLSGGHGFLPLNALQLLLKILFLEF